MGDVGLVVALGLAEIVGDEDSWDPNDLLGSCASFLLREASGDCCQA